MLNATFLRWLLAALVGWRERQALACLLRARESGSDLVQSVCREILAQAHRFQHPSESAFRRWLYTTAMRKISDRADHWRAECKGRKSELRGQRGELRRRV